MSDKYIFNLEKFQTLINNKDDFTKKDLVEDVLSSFGLNKIDIINGELISSLVFNMEKYPSLKDYFDYVASTLLYNIVINSNKEGFLDNRVKLEKHIKKLWMNIVNVSNNDLP
jgi:hypothetical protein